MIRPRNIDVRARYASDRKPRGPALVLLNVVRHNPGAVVKALLNTAFRERNALSLQPSMEQRPNGRPRGKWRVPV